MPESEREGIGSATRLKHQDSNLPTSAHSRARGIQLGPHRSICLKRLEFPRARGNERVVRSACELRQLRQQTWLGHGWPVRQFLRASCARNERVGACPPSVGPATCGLSRLEEDPPGFDCCDWRSGSGRRARFGQDGTTSTLRFCSATSASLTVRCPAGKSGV